jgi:hypothetical protein
LFLESTDVPADRTAAEITAELVKAGARHVSTQYGEGGKVIGLTWSFRVGSADISFALPARIDAVYNLLKSRATGYVDKAKLTAKAERIAWRQLFRWIQAQNAMIQSGMVQGHEVFMPYVIAPGSNHTMFQAWTAQLALPAASEKKGGAS